MGPRFKVSSERQEKPGIELTSPGFEGKWLNHYTTEASRDCSQYKKKACDWSQ